MAPDPAIMKRQRTAPRSWWAAAPTIAPPAKIADESRPAPANPDLVRKSTLALSTGNMAGPRVSPPAVKEAKASRNTSKAAETKSIGLENHENNIRTADTAGRRSSGRIKDRPSEYWVVSSLSEKSRSQNSAPTAGRSTRAIKNTVKTAKKHETRIGDKSSSSKITARLQIADISKNKKPKPRQGVMKNQPHASLDDSGTDRSGVVESSEQDELVAVETATSSFSRTKAGQQGRVTTSQPIPGGEKITKRKQAAIDQRADQQRRKKRASSTSDKMAAHEGMSSTRPAATEVRSPKRRRVDAVDIEVRNEPEISLKFAHLKSGTRQVSRHTIDSKWEVLPHESIERISQMLHAAERPILAHAQDERRRILVNSAINMVNRKLIRKIGKGIPFPPRTRGQTEDDFDFEGVLNTQNLLYSQLTPAMHTNALLEAELKQRKNKLEYEKADLSELEANAKSEASKRKQDHRKIHQLLQHEDKAKEELIADLGIQIDRGTVPPPLHASNDTKLLSLIQEVNDHVSSMQGNMSQIQGIGEAIANGKAAIQTTLFEHLMHDQYEEVVLG
ncbi:hypothetical protein BP5796_06391 [Coleophoma crateriformis]|uniref:Kinetochore protein fta7 n=1 Tax=Coleophoma crateriformis TaxID=565419 RepID=A0A3D8RNN7_9HELO|nr:hypothetical protein BP5796_06391 [Coleophoma crateriformis]